MIIHKAAHSNASKEELAKLGRVVERIKRGEPISEGGNPRSSINAAGSATSAAAQAGPSRPILAAPSIVVVEDSSDSDADVDMTGAKQVGGGTIPTQQQSTPRTPAQSVTSMQGRPTPEQVIHPVLSLSSASPVLPRAPHPGQLSSKTSGGVTPVPPPRPIHPPPFLLVAFKEAPTEKYLLPLGLQSFVSRIGGDYVTGPPPAERKVEKPPLAASQSMPNTVAPSILSDDMRVPVVPLSKSGVGRTRAALRGTKPETTASAPELANAANDETMLEGTVNVSNRKLDLLPLPSMDPPAGTVLFSTMVPARNWVRPVWAELAKRLPFVKPGFGGSQAEVGTDHSESTLSSGKDAAQSSPGDFLHQEAPAPGVDSSKHRQSTLLNLAATSFIPTEGDVHPVTIRLGEIDDRAWRRIKHVLDEVERTEMVTLGVTRSASIRAESATPIEVPSDPNNSDLSKSAALQTAPVPLFSAPFKPGFHPRSIYTQRKRSYFKNLLLRNPRRRFLRQRLPSPLLSLIEATSDRWAARPYPISTKALYTTDGGYAVPTLPVPNSPEPLKKKRRVEGEPEVTFELPVSLDALDERVAEGAMRGLTKRGRGRGGRTDSTKRKYAERAPLDRACEGCGRVGRKLWRPGPGGKRTRQLIPDANDKWLMIGAYWQFVISVGINTSQERWETSKILLRPH